MIKDSDGKTRFYGVYRGVVVDTRDPLNKNRIRLQVPQVLANQTTSWAWPVVGVSNIQASTPAVGDGVFVMFEGGDPSFPLWSGIFSGTLDPIGPTGPTGPSGPTGPTGPTGGGYWCSYYDTTTQAAETINTATAMTLNTHTDQSGISLVSGSRITVANAGVYDLQFSAQLHNFGGGGSGTEIYIWLRKNGTNVPDSATRVDVITNSPYIAAAWDFMLPLNAGDYLELMWSTTNLNIKITALSASSPVPAIPSLIVTMMQV